jgi:hypothetical protein
VRLFWSLIVVLALATAGLYLARINGAFERDEADVTRMELPAWEGELVEAAVPDDPDAAVQDGAVEAADASGTPETNEPATPGGVDPEVLERLRARVKGEQAPGPSESTTAQDSAVVGPAYTLGDDGALTIELENGAVTLSGDGSASSPYVVPWDVLRAVRRVYDPRQGKRTLPDWLDALDGKQVSIEGNTLVPLVSSQTEELLVMQNPWDGCCIGVPPTPYDAIEVKLRESVTFSISATGYGRITGAFEVDPYEVGGWLMGLFLITDASYTSGAGEELPGL